VRRGGTIVTFDDKCAKAAGYRNPAVAMAKLHALAKEVKTYEEHHILAGYMEATIMRSLGGGHDQMGPRSLRRQRAD
jgi:hypothetical protein